MARERSSSRWVKKEAPTMNQTPITSTSKPSHLIDLTELRDLLEKRPARRDRRDPPREVFRRGAYPRRASPPARRIRDVGLLARGRAVRESVDDGPRDDRHAFVELLDLALLRWKRTIERRP